MTTESFDVIIGAKNNASGPLKSATKDQQEYEKNLGNTADTSARTTAALALMLQAMDAQDSQYGKLISDLALFKGTLDAVRAATVENASEIEKITAKLLFWVQILRLGKQLFDQVTGANAAQAALNKQLERRNQIEAEFLEIKRSQFNEQKQEALGEDSFEKRIDGMRRLAAETKQQLQNEEQRRDRLDEIKRAEEAHVDATLNSAAGLNKFRKIDEETLASATKNAKELGKQHRELTKEIEKLEAAERKRLFKEETAFYKARDENNKSIVQSLEDQVSALRDNSDELILAELRANGVRKADEERAIAAIKLRKELEEKQRVEAESLATARRQEQSDKNYLNRLRATVIELQHGTDAAREFREAQSGISKEAQREGDQYRAQIDALKERNRLNAEAQKIIESNRTPLERFKAEYEKLAKIKIATGLDDNNFSKELNKLKDQLKQGLSGSGAARTPSALQNESSRFLSRAGGTDSPVQQTAQNTKAIAEAMKKAEIIYNETNKLLTAAVAGIKQKPRVFQGSK